MFAIESAIQRKICDRRVSRTGKGINLVISNEDMDDIIRIIEPLKNSDVFFSGVSETVKHKIKRQEGGSLGLLLGTLGDSTLGNILNGKDIMRARKGDIIAGKGVARTGKGYHNMFHMDQHF